jgi:hypothetical protein
MEFEVRSGGEVIFGMYEDGNVLIKANPTLIQTTAERLQDGIQFLNEWAASASSRGCTVSTVFG